MADISMDLYLAYEDGYKKGKAETEAYLLHSGDVTPVDVKPVVHGHWIVRCGNYNEAFECSECQHISKDGGNFCPNCGTRMDDDGNNN